MTKEERNIQCKLKMLCHAGKTGPRRSNGNRVDVSLTQL